VHTPSTGEPRPPLRGFLNIDKPAGITSFDVVRQIRRAAGVRKVGHAGILDQPASGVLPVAIGNATKLIDEVMHARKGYRTTIRLGATTDTYDATGEVTSTAPAQAVAGITRAAVEAALTAFQGVFEQLPPAYSAIKRGGVPAYKAARRGEAVELEPRTVEVHALTLEVFDPPLLQLAIECGKGFYVRSLAFDLGRALGVGGHVETLRRTAVGRFTIEQATPLDVAVRRLVTGDWATLLHAPDAVLTAWPVVILGQRGAAAVRLGQDVLPLPGERARSGRPGELARGYGPDGALLALLEARQTAAAWHPYRVFTA